MTRPMIPNDISFYKDCLEVGEIVTSGKIGVSLVATVPDQSRWALVIDPLTGDQFRCVSLRQNRSTLLDMYLELAQNPNKSITSEWLSENDFNWG